MFQKIGVVNWGWIPKLRMDIFKASFRILACTMKKKKSARNFPIPDSPYFNFTDGKLFRLWSSEVCTVIYLRFLSVSVRNFRLCMPFCVIPTFVTTHKVVACSFEELTHLISLYKWIFICSKRVQILFPMASQSS